MRAIYIARSPASKKRSKPSIGTTSASSAVPTTELRAVLAHNRDEEIEHATMTLEWLRRNMPAWDEALRTYLFTEGPITEIEEQGRRRAVLRRAREADAAVARSDLGIGSQRRAR